MKKSWIIFATWVLFLFACPGLIAEEDAPPPLSPEQRALRIEAINKKAFQAYLPKIYDKKSLSFPSNSLFVQRVGEKFLRNGIHAQFERLIAKSNLSQHFTDKLVNDSGTFYLGDTKAFRLPLQSQEKIISANMPVSPNGSEVIGRVFYYPDKETINISVPSSKHSYLSIDSEKQPEEFAKLKKALLEVCEKRYEDNEKNMSKVAAGEFEIPDTNPSEQMIQAFGPVTVIELDGEEALQITKKISLFSFDGGLSEVDYIEIIRRRDGALLKSIQFSPDGVPTSAVVYFNYSYEVPDSAFAIPEGLETVNCKDELSALQQTSRDRSRSSQNEKYIPLLEPQYLTSYSVLPGMSQEPAITPEKGENNFLIWLSIGIIVIVICGTIYIIQKRRHA